MGRILFLSAVALVAYRYIVRSNKQHQALNDGNTVEVLPPSPASATTTIPALREAVDASPEPTLVGAGSRAAEPDSRS
jgi:hypothetical protein